MAREIKIVVDNNNTNPVFVVDGNIYVLAGNGAVITKLENATPVERECAIGPNSDCDLARSFKSEYENQNIRHTIIEPDTDNTVFDPVAEEVIGDGDTAEAPQNKNCENKGCFDPSAYKVDNSYFESAVDFLCRCSAEDFLELVSYAKKHNNTFFRCVKELSDVVNADDCYCTAIIKLSRHLGEEVEKKAFELFHEAIEKDEYEFAQFWMALQTINYFCK